MPEQLRPEPKDLGEAAAFILYSYFSPSCNFFSNPLF